MVLRLTQSKGRRQEICFLRLHNHINNMEFKLLNVCIYCYSTHIIIILIIINNIIKAPFIATVLVATKHDMCWWYLKKILHCVFTIHGPRKKFA